MLTMDWIDHNGGIGASSDSFYEYLLKAYILFGELMARFDSPVWLPAYLNQYKAMQFF